MPGGPFSHCLMLQYKMPRLLPSDFLKYVFVCLLLGWIFGSNASMCFACVTVGSQPVLIADESAIIVWDSSMHTEHFIRTVSFDTKSTDFGFLVPTPTTPELETADDSAVPFLTDLLQPHLRGEVTQVIPTSIWFTMLGGLTGSYNLAHTLGMDNPGGIDIVAEQHVAGIESITLAASNTASLERWMKANKYPWSTDQSNWLKPYIDRHWKITLFKFTKTPGMQGAVASNLLKMSFKTDRPFFPYSEPQSQREPGAYDTHRLLRVFVLGNSRMDGVLASNGEQVVWPGRTICATPLTTEQRNRLAPLLRVGSEDLPGGSWLTAFDDSSSPRPGVADLYFSPSDNHGEVRPHPLDERIKHNYFISIDLVAILVLILVSVVLKRMKKAGRITNRYEAYKALAAVLCCFLYVCALVSCSGYYFASI